jgi:hypothetical protein
MAGIYKTARFKEKPKPPGVVVNEETGDVTIIAGHHFMLVFSEKQFDDIIKFLAERIGMEEP